MKTRCFGNKPNQTLYAEYHDHEWGVPVHEDQHLLEMLILEGAQAGLSWETVLKKREAYRKAFHHFDPRKVAVMSDEQLEKLCVNPSIIRNRLKIFSARQNARVFRECFKYNESEWQRGGRGRVKKTYKNCCVFNPRGHQ